MNHIDKIDSLYNLPEKERIKLTGSERPTQFPNLLFIGRYLYDKEKKQVKTRIMEESTLKQMYLIENKYYIVRNRKLVFYKEK
jgi:hypothetical protein